MEQTLQPLVGILQKAVPTIFLLLFLYFYLKSMLFGPLAKVQKQRDALTKGARKTAEESLASAERKTAEFENKLRDARSEVYREQEEMRKKWLADQTAQVEQAREKAVAAARAAKEQIAREAVDAKATLSTTSNQLADQIASSILNRRVQ
jgi:F-type H+-transporting ATPase subunit b